MLLAADLLLVSRFGWLMASLFFAARLGDIILLLALLAGTLGRLIEERVRREVVVTVDTATAVSSTVKPQRSLALGNHI